MNFVELAKALGWPVATIVVAICVTLSIWMIIARSADVNLNFWDKVKFAARGGPVIPDRSESVVETGATTASAPTAESSAEAVPQQSDSTLGNVADTHEPPKLFFLSENEYELSPLFEAFKQTSDYRTDPELWDVIYLNRCFELGTGGSEDDLRRLARDNPDWATPWASLIRRAAANHDVRAGEVALSEAIKRRQSAHFDWVIWSGTQFHYKMNGPARAFDFCIEWSSADIDTKFKFDGFVALADLFKADGLKSAYRMALELALSFIPAKENSRFSLAYSYSESSSHWPATLYHYSKLINSSKPDSMAWNNFAVLISKFDKRLQAESFYKAHELNNALASSNLARLLIDDGYISVGESILDAITDNASAAEHIASTRAAALAGRRQIEKRGPEVQTPADNQFSLYRAALLESFRFRQVDRSQLHGQLVSKDGSTRVYIDSAGAACLIVAGASTFEGILSDNFFGYAGEVTARGSTILEFNIREVVLFQTGLASARLIQWPRNVAENSKLEIVDLLPIEGAFKVARPQLSQA